MENDVENKHIAHEDDAIEALDSEIVVWRVESRFAIESCFNNNRKTFSELPPAFAAGAAFSFFKGFVENVFPASLGATLLKRA